jgi:hypothetical protein
MTQINVLPSLSKVVHSVADLVLVYVNLGSLQRFRMQIRSSESLNKNEHTQCPQGIRILLCPNFFARFL